VCFCGTKNGDTMTYLLILIFLAAVFFTIHEMIHAPEINDIDDYQFKK
jgi:hypothetical protein